MGVGSGADLVGISRKGGGGEVEDFQKKIEKFVDLFLGLPN